MDTKYILGPNGELYHWGIKGMKWGVRRYQNKDGSLTKAGKKRYDKLEAELNKLGGKSGEKHPAKKSMSDMTDDELRAHTTRMQLEKNYLDAQRNLAAVTPQNVSPKKLKRGRDFLNNMLNDVVAPAVKNTAKEWLEKTLKDKAGLNEKIVDPLKKLENEAKQAEQEFKKADWKKKLERLNNKDDTDDGDTTYEERNKRENYRKSVADRDSGLEDLQRYRNQLEAIYGKNAQDKIEKKLKERAKQHGIDYGDD